MSSLLGICIPTYNRADKLDRNLRYLLQFAPKHNIPIYISENCSSDHTLLVIEKYKLLYPNITFFSHDENIGSDRNFEYVLKMSACDYSWLLGDDDFILYEYLESILATLNDKSPDFVVVNSRNQVNEKLPQTYASQHKLLEDLGWHMTFISCLIYSKRCIKEADFNRYMDKGFVHVGAVFDYLSQKDEINVIWMDDCCITTLREDDELPSWYPKLLDVFVENWANTIYTLPIVYSSDTKLKAIKKLWTHSAIMSLKALVILRAYGFIDSVSFKQFRSRFKALYGWKTIFIFGMSITPLWLIKRPIMSVYQRYVKQRVQESERELKQLFKH